jgi:hypothetical protein
MVFPFIGIVVSIVVSIMAQEYSGIADYSNLIRVLIDKKLVREVRLGGS